MLKVTPEELARLIPEMPEGAWGLPWELLLESRRTLERYRGIMRKYPPQHLRTCEMNAKHWSGEPMPGKCSCGLTEALKEN